MDPTCTSRIDPLSGAELARRDYKRACRKKSRKTLDNFYGKGKVYWVFGR